MFYVKQISVGETVSRETPTKKQCETLEKWEKQVFIL